MEQQNKTCQNCKKDFTIESEDFAFYEKIKVPSPTWCVDCQTQRRLLWRNESHLYRREDSLNKKNLISIFSQDKNYKVYEQKDWWSDSWDPLEFGKDYDFTKPFFTQFDELMHAVPHPSLINKEAVNSDYCNSTVGNKDSYLVFGGDYNENVSYTTFSFYAKDSQDLYWVEKSEKSYELVDSDRCYNSAFGRYAYDCVDSKFLYDSKNIQNSLGVVNLRNGSNIIFNRVLNKSAYEEEIAEYDLGSYKKLVEAKEKFRKFMLSFPRRAHFIIKSVNCIGDNIREGKNCKNCFDILSGGTEDCKNIFLAGLGLRDSQSCTHLGYNTELAYDSTSLVTCSRVLFSKKVWNGMDVSYSYNCHNCAHIFGCVGLRSKQYCILNKQYTKEEYEELVPKIIEHMG